MQEQKMQEQKQNKQGNIQFKWSGIEFVKMHGSGNDFILIDEFSKSVVEEKEKPEFVEKVCKRRFGVGADGVIFIQKSDLADLKFRYFNSDGGEAEMCGNGIRCFARLAFERGYVGTKFKAETLAGLKDIEVRGRKVKVDMGKVLFSPKDIPVIEDGKVDGLCFCLFNGEKVYAVNTGVPHAVIFSEFDLNLAKKIRYSEKFPEGTNVNFVKVINKNEIEVRTYERGVEEETLSCGTGSVASVAVSFKLGLVSKNVKVLTKGGELTIELNNEWNAYLTGSAIKAFEGVISEIW